MNDVIKLSVCDHYVNVTIVKAGLWFDGLSELQSKMNAIKEKSITYIGIINRNHQLLVDITTHV